MINSWLQANGSSSGTQKHLTAKNIPKEENGRSQQSSQVAKTDSRTHARFKSTGGLNGQSQQKISSGFIDGTKSRARKNGDVPAIQTDFQNLNYTEGQAPSQSNTTQNAANPNSPNGVTNITNIIYNFNVTPSQQLQKKQMELY